MNKIFRHIKQLSFYDTLRHGSVYMFAYVAVQVLMLFSLPIFTKLLTPSDFGIFEVFNNTVRFLGIIVSLNLFNGFYRFYFETNTDKAALIRYLLGVSLLSFLVGALFLFVFRHAFMKLVSLPASLFVWLLVAVFANVVFNFFNTYLNAQRLSTRSGIWQFIYQFSRLTMSVVFVLFVARNYYGRIAGENVILLLLSVVVLVVYFRKYAGAEGMVLNKKEIIRYSVSFIPIGLSGFVLGYLDTIMINNFAGSNDAGLYSYAYKIAVIYTGITTAFVTANRPKLFELMNQQKEDEVIAQMRSMFKLVVALSCLFIFFSAEGGKILALNKSFHAGLYLMPVLILSYIFNDLNELYTFYFHYEKKVNYFYISFAVSAGINFVLNLILIPKYGYEAAAYTTLISYAFMLTSTYIICKRLLKVRVPAVTRFIDYFVIIAAVLAFNYLATTNIGNWWLQMTVKGVVFLGVLGYLWKNLLQQYLNTK